MKTRLLILCLLLLPLYAIAGNLPPLVVPQGLGLNLDFVSDNAGDLDMIRGNGARVVRMDFRWNGAERDKGVYNLSGFDKMTEALLQRGIRPLYILDYGNKLYAEDAGVRTPEARKAFANYAAAAAAHFKGKGIIWEIWNEPNGTTWPPAPNAAEYTALVKEAVTAMRKADPAATIVAGATSLVDLPFLEDCFRNGMLPFVDAVSVHPYRLFPPESLPEDISRLRALIARYSPDRPNIPVISSEWGYSTVKISYDDVDQTRQGQFFPRAYLMCQSLGLPVQIWFKWRDNGTNPNDPEDHFGTLLPDRRHPKPSYLAAQRLVEALNGMHFVKRLPSAAEDYLFVFTNDTASTLAVWTTGKPHTLAILPGQRTELTGDPQYLPVPATATAMLATTCWAVDVQTPYVMCGGNAKGLAPSFAVNVRNPFAKPVTVKVRALDVKNLAGKFVGKSQFTLAPQQQTTLRWQGKNPLRRDGNAIGLTVEVTVDGVVGTQAVKFTGLNPLTARVVSLREGGVAAMLRMPANEKFTGTLDAQFGASTHSLALSLNPATKKFTARTIGRGAKSVHVLQVGEDIIVPLPWPAQLPADAIRVQLREKKVLVTDSGVVHLQPVAVNTANASAIPGGDAAIAATFKMTDVTYTNPDIPADKAVHFTYDYAKGWKYVEIMPAKPWPVDGKPRELGMWVRGNQSGALLNMRLVDSNKRTYQISYGLLNFDGWRYMSVRVDGSAGMFQWGGTGEPGKIAYPIYLATPVLVDGMRSAMTGDLEFAGMHFIYTE